METNVYKNEALDNYISEIASRVVAESGIPSDKYHFGKLILQSLKDDPDFIMQTDGGTGESETNSSVLRRSIRCTACFRKLGLTIGDVIILMGTLNLDQAIPFYAALFEGIIIAAIDRTLLVNELKDTFEVNKPKLIFCQSERVKDAKKAVELAGLDAKVISYDSNPDAISFAEMMEKYGEDIDVKDYKVADLDPDETIALLLATSGSTGLPKASILTHKSVSLYTTNIGSFSKSRPPITKSALIVAPIQWLSALIHYLGGPILKYARVQSSKEQTTEHIFELINTYKPSLTMLSPPMCITLLNAAETIKCDFSCFEVIFIGGSAAPEVLLRKLKTVASRAQVGYSYGMSELGSMAFNAFNAPHGSCGQRFSDIEYKLVDVETEKEINEPNVVGELWLRTASGFKGYYNSPEVSAEVITKDGWYKTGDLFYRDKDWNVYFVERLKLLLKYRNHQISPAELEAVIFKHPDVENVAVTGVPDPDSGELPIAFVVPKPGASLTEQDVKDIVKDNLTDTKQLRGGVVFLKQLPLLPTSKLNRKQLKKMAEAYAKKE